MRTSRLDRELADAIQHAPHCDGCTRSDPRCAVWGKVDNVRALLLSGPAWWTVQQRGGDADGVRWVVVDGLRYERAPD